jgi:hypothetical protein
VGKGKIQEKKKKICEVAELCCGGGAFPGNQNPSQASLKIAAKP